jgi:hypothetical protein
MIATFRLQEVVAQSDHLRNVILQYKETLLAQVQQTAGCNALHKADARLARWLLQTRDRIDSDLIPLTQDFLSEMLGVRRTTVTLVAGGLQKAGLIRYRRGMLKSLTEADSNKRRVNATASFGAELIEPCRRRLRDIWHHALQHDQARARDAAAIRVSARRARPGHSACRPESAWAPRLLFSVPRFVRTGSLDTQEEIRSQLELAISVEALTLTCCQNGAVKDRLMRTAALFYSSSGAALRSPALSISGPIFFDMLGL